MALVWDAEQGVKAASWVGFYIFLYALMAASCEVGVPENCTRATDAMDVLTELPFLFVFAVGQASAFMCGILNETRYHALSKKMYFPVLVIASGLATSALMNNDGFEGLHDPGGDLSPAEAALSIILLILVALVFAYHYFLAWKFLPGGWLGWGMVSGQVAEPSPPSRAENRYLQYMVSITVIMVYIVLFSAFAYSRGDEWDYHYILLAWLMSLIASFDDYISVAWLGITTGMFLQGVGAYSFRVLLQGDDD
ncbi:unnamed protein product [Ectocarpus sp. 12 AP-2014]